MQEERDGKSHFQQVLQSATSFAIVVTDRDGIVTDWNRGAELILGWTAAEIVGQPAEVIFTPEDRDAGRVRVEMTMALQDGQANDERWHMKVNGSHFWASGELMPLREESGTHVGFVKILRDRILQNSDTHR